MGASHWTGNLPASGNGLRPPFSFWRPKKRNGPRPVQREKTLCRAPVQWPSARTGVFRDSADQTCQSSAGSRRTTHLSHPCAAYLVRRKTGGGRRMAPAPEPAAALWPREGPFQRADTQVRPYGRTRNRHRLVGAGLCVGPCPAREGQRQRLRSRLRLCRLTLDSRPRLRRATDVASPLRGDAAYPLRVKEKRTVSPTSPGLDDPKGSAFPSLITVREGQPSPAGGRRSAHVRTDPPNIFSFPPAATHFLFDVSKRKWGAEGITVPR